ncbi:hypothetical protein BV898_15168 [Hypsibius exemplaris]|uniref:Uncharacterized protein n=1 Tax=Hypsibius exemplaris TaxID=2072580 RepID=A0A9X6RJZ4_HYPEX|nr:hypothetical protein BV898_15168 [Hypsibius exemplaris]
MAVVGLAKLHHDKGSYGESVKVLQQYVDHCQDDLTYCTGLAHCLFMAKNYTDASFIYETIIQYYKETQFTLASVPVPVLSRYCAAQLFANADEGRQAKETIAEILRSEKVNFEDPESEYHMVAAKRSHIVSTSLLIAWTYLEKGSYLEAFRKAKETLRLHPWHLEQENNAESSRKTWTVLKKIFLTGLRQFHGLLTDDSINLTALIPEVISDLADMEQFMQTLKVTDRLTNGSTSGLIPKTVAEEARQLRLLCQAYLNRRRGFSNREFTSTDKSYKSEIF